MDEKAKAFELPPVPVESKPVRVVEISDRIFVLGDIAEGGSLAEVALPRFIADLKAGGDIDGWLTEISYLSPEIQMKIVNSARIFVEEGKATCLVRENDGIIHEFLNRMEAGGFGKRLRVAETIMGVNHGVSDFVNEGARGISRVFRRVNTIEGAIEALRNTIAEFEVESRKGPERPKALSVKFIEECGEQPDWDLFQAFYELVTNLYDHLVLKEYKDGIDYADWREPETRISLLRSNALGQVILNEFPDFEFVFEKLADFSPAELVILRRELSNFAKENREWSHVLPSGELSTTYVRLFDSQIVDRRKEGSDRRGKDRRKNRTFEESPETLMDSFRFWLRRVSDALSLDERARHVFRALADRRRWEFGDRREDERRDGELPPAFVLGPNDEPIAHAERLAKAIDENDGVKRIN